MQPLKAILFDLDGTLIDTAPEFADIATRLRAEAGLSPLDQHVFRQAVSYGAIGMVSQALDMEPEAKDFSHWHQRFLTEYETSLGALSKPFRGLSDVIAECHQAGLFWGVVTNKLERFAKPLMSKMPLTPRADVLITPDHVTHPKPHPEPLLLACQILNCPAEQTVYIGDHVRDIESGREAGCRTIAAAYGYLTESERVEDWGADEIASSPEQLAEMIRGAMS